MALLKRALWLAALAGAAWCAWALARSRRASPPVATRVPGAPAPAASAPAWVPPVDARCPDGYPVKANDNSGIYHVPGGRFYERTRAERCYATPEAAEADGYRRAKA